MAFFRDDVYAPVAPSNDAFEHKKFELRSSRVINECTCVRKNGLQGECFRAECVKKNVGDGRNVAKEPPVKEAAMPTPQAHGDSGVPVQQQEPLQPVVQNTPETQNNLRSASKSQIIHSKSQLLNQTPQDVNNSGTHTHTQNSPNFAQVTETSAEVQQSIYTVQNTPRQPPQEVAPAAPQVHQQSNEMQQQQQQPAPNQPINSNPPREVHEECIDPTQCEMLSTQTPAIKRSCGLTDTPPNELIEYPHQVHPPIDESFTQQFQQE